jgi:hypothetical protein
LHQFRAVDTIHYKFKRSTVFQEPLVIGGTEYRERFKRENGQQQLTEASSPVRDQSSNSDVSEVVDRVVRVII